MATLYTHQQTNMNKTWALMGIFFIIVIGIGFLFAQVYNAPEVLIIAIVFSVVMNVVAYWYSHKIVLKMHKARPVTRESNRELWNIVENLSITAGLPMPDLYLIEDEVPNAFATGRDPKHAVVGVTTGLLSLLEKTELEGVIAHELSHIGNRDMLISTVAVVLVGFIALLADIFLRMTIFGGMRGNEDRGGAGALLVVVGIIFAIIAPLVAKLIQLAVSRKREYVADASGALLTRYPEGLAQALEKIALHSGKMKHTSHATAHLFISNPFGEHGGRMNLNSLFRSHPPAKKRIEKLRMMS